ncbi:hypothetical protein GXB85_00705 [Cellulomonas sp. APG4]|uniref:hypothetical protein n=1 Tax=Cellulomonas sp. APG4 TaxID=1538656 RepID=UPI00137AD815|nr:hypothetical protein [Cellulomonas sp. APG4]NCT89478.1 hypothetical protein [Cellulomonas sp. APG4]
MSTTRPPAVHVVDVFVYVTVLNLAVEYVPAVLSETFSLSLLTAVLLKAVLEVVVRVKAAVVGHLRAAGSAAGRLVAGGMLVLVLPGSKLLVLWVVDLVFGDAVRLGGFWAVTALIAVLLLARLGVRRLVT